MSKQLKSQPFSKLNSMTDEQIIKETENIKDKTREVGARMLKKCDETEDIAELTQIMLDEQTNCMETISDNLDELDMKVKESKSLSQQFASWFSIFRSTKTRTTHYVIKEEKTKEEKIKRTLPEKKEKKEYEFKSDDPADEIAEKLNERLDIFARYATNYNETLKKQAPLLDTIADKVDKSDCDIKNVTKTIKKF